MLKIIHSQHSNTISRLDFRMPVYRFGDTINPMKVLINGIHMAYEVVGQGIPILWIPGFPLDRSIWKPQVQGLSDCGRHILPDLR